MTVKILCVGDVVGRPGRQALAYWVPRLIVEEMLHCVIVNAENAAGGSGLTAALYEKICNYGVHLITMGDHIYKRRDLLPVLEQATNIVRPANLPPEAIGKEWAVLRPQDGPPVAVVSLLGRLYMKPVADCPFHAVQRVLESIPADVKIIVVDVHAEATSEKVAMGWYLDGRVTAVVGTHTHVPTADARILPKGTAYITDLGMTGPYNSVLGRNVTKVLKAMTTAVPTTFDIAAGDTRLAGLIIEADPHTGRAVNLKQVILPVPQPVESPAGQGGIQQADQNCDS